MKTTLTFEMDDNNEGQEFDRARLEAIIKSNDAFMILFDLSEKLRVELKHGELRGKTYKKVEEIQEWLWEALRENNINLNSIVF